MSNVSKKRKFDPTTPVNFPGTPVRTFYPNRSSMSPKLTAPQLAQVKRVIFSNKEKKHTFGTTSGVAPGYTGTIYQIGLPPQGSNGSQRIGDEIQNVRYKVKGNIQGTNTHAFRFIAFQWKSANGTAPVPSDILTNGFLGTNNATQGPYNEDNHKKVKILYDRTFALDGYNQIKLFNFNVKCLGIEFVNGSNTLAQNAIYVLILQDGTVSLNAIWWSDEVEFTDA